MIRLLSFCLMLGLIPGPVWAQKRQPAPPRQERPAERLQKMSPKQRQKALEKIPPERRAAIEKRLENLERMSPEERARLAQFRSLSPERQQAVRQAARRLSALPQDRQAALKQELSEMKGLTTEERQARMNSKEFKGRLAPGERKLVKDLAEVVPD